ncbi:M1 family metallopeptidase [Nocardioides lentus]|uniref:Aminopeptidase N n=2 Tax=Nocardioides lentus TaxID=338077 RepID=A0ABP5AIQ4_9ACTN
MSCARSLAGRTVPALVALLASGVLAVPAALPASASPRASTALPAGPVVLAAPGEAPVAGARTAGDSLFPHVGNGGYDARHYDLDLRWTPAPRLARSRLQATTRMRAVTTGPPLASFSLDFERGGMRVSSVTVDGERASYRSIDRRARIEHKLVVTPATPVEGTFTTVVRYAGVPTRHVDRDGSAEGWNATDDGAVFVNQPIGAMTAYPHNNTPADKATYAIDVDVPRTLTNAAGRGPLAVASNGLLVGRVSNAAGTRTTWRWRQPHPMASELSMISIGKYDVIRDRVRLAGGRRVPEWSFVDAEVGAAARARVERQRDRWARVLDGLGRLFGPYPGVSTGVVVDRVPAAVDYALETQDRSFFPGDVDPETFVHEAAHQWFGDHVSPVDWNDLWINEGMATWAPTWFAHRVGRPAGPTTGTVYHRRWARTPADDPSWRIPPTRVRDSADLFGDQAYERGAQAWEALRLTIGPRAFRDLLRTWQERYGGRSAGTGELEALAAEVSGQDLDLFFDDWLRDPDKPVWPRTAGTGG